MISGNTYEELYEILGYMDKLTVMKIPEELLCIISQRRNIKYKTKIDRNDIFNKKNISDETLDLLCYIDYNYWMDEDKKNEINMILKEKEEEKRERYNPDSLFKKENDNIAKSERIIKNELNQYREPILKKIWKKILRIFKE